MNAPVRMEHTPPQGFVYCIVHHERRAAKIGFSHDPQKRLRQMQTASPDPLTLYDKLPGDRPLRPRSTKRWPIAA